MEIKEVKHQNKFSDQVDLKGWNQNYDKIIVCRPFLKGISSSKIRHKYEPKLKSQKPNKVYP